jgi:hypothetical protein
MACGYEHADGQRHMTPRGGTVTRRTGRLDAWPDEHSARLAHKTKRNRAPGPPAVGRSLVENGARVPQALYGASTVIDNRNGGGLDMRKVTRTPRGTHRAPGSSGVNITPLSANTPAGR